RSSRLVAIRERDYDKSDHDAMMKLYENSVSAVKEAEIFQGKILAIETDFVAVDIGFKSEGRIPIAEFTNLADLNIGDPVEVFIEKIEDKDGRLIVSRKRAEFMRVWKRITQSSEKGEVLQGTVMRRIKGGLVIDLLGVEAFLPGSQIDVRPVRDFDSFIGKVLDVRVVKINHPYENVVVSHKILIEEEMAGQRAAIIQSLEKGQVLQGHVKAITDFGIFVDLGGVDGLVHITDLSWGRITTVQDFIKLDEEVNVVVLDFDQEKKRISLGMKQLTPHPWENIEERFPLRMKVEGRVVSLTDYGAFVELEKGVEGLVHISEMSWTQHIKHPSQIVALGQTVEAIVVELNKDEKKLALSMKQLEPDPWFKLMEKYPVGSRHLGIVKTLANFGAFIELEKGVDGLIHISDLSWTKKIRHPGEIIKRGDSIDVQIMEINVEQRRISLGHKQLIDNPWEALENVYALNAETEGTVVRNIEGKGLIVELPMGVDGFVPASHLSQSPVKNITEKFQVGDVLHMKVLEFDKENKRIVLSVLEYLKAKDQQTIDEYVQAHHLPSITLKEVISAPIPKIEFTETDMFLDFTPEVPLDDVMLSPETEPSVQKESLPE
ncbi:MAG: 30S ribosomal protein S1, partial [Ignavibacteriales bacterium]|nr:30S ribosomal protein S1 [Ignavibacteriales bacterium]